MTLAEFQPFVERALVAIEWSIARTRREQALLDERKAVEFALEHAEDFNLEREPLAARLVQLRLETTQDVTADQVSVHPLRSVPMDLVTIAVVRRLFKVPSNIPILGLKVVPPQEKIEITVGEIASRWKTANGQSGAPEDEVSAVHENILS